MEAVRVVLDTSVLVAGTRSGRGASRRLLHGVRDRRFTPLVSVPLASEYEAVLLRSEHLVAAGVTEAEMLALIDDILAAAEAIDRYYLVRPLLRDPADHHVVETAVNGQADLLVSLNIRDLAPAARLYPFRLVTPGDALRELRHSGV
ncbi:MAG: putative toxin-antitoxin system toxin component, PIN family [Geminicoccaceae bacterium]